MRAGGDVVRHGLRLDEAGTVLRTDLTRDAQEVLRHPVDQDGAPILRREHDVILAIERYVSV